MRWVADMNRKYVLRNKKRFAAMLTVFIALLAFTFFAVKSYGYREPQYKLIAVQEGDTLWDIAIKYSNGSDIRRYIYEIKKINNIPDSIIYPGTLIKIPLR